MKNLIVVMSAGASTRIKTTKSKILQDLAGSTVLSYLLRTLQAFSDTDIAFVVKHQKEQVIEEVKNYLPNAIFVEQERLDGTGGAVRDAMASLNKNYDRVLVLPADTPLIPVDILKSVLEQKANAFVLGVKLETQTYGRLLVEGKELKAILEPQHDGYSEASNIVNTSIYSFDYEFLKNNINNISKNSAKNEIFLTDIIAVASNSNTASYMSLDSSMQNFVLGPNTLPELIKLGKYLYKTRVEYFMSNGVYFVDPDTVYIDREVKIEKDVVIYPNVILKGNTHLSSGVLVYEGSRLENTSIGTGTVVKPYSILYDSKIGPDNQIGPFAHIRFNTNTNTGVKIGAFAETKNAIIDEFSKIPHLSYVGDASLGKKVNIGCGVITCNYDGFKKNKTIIGDNVFVGSDSQLIAPVRLGNGSYVAAGTTVTSDVPEDALAISRTKQLNKENFVKKFKERKQSV